MELAASNAALGPGLPEAVPEVVAALQGFTVDLYGQLSTRPGNLVCSPYSVAVALAMTRNGARGTTAAEMDAVLHAPALSGLNGGLNALGRLVESRAGDVERADGSTASVSLDIASSLWGQRGRAWVMEFLDALAADYAAGMRLVDYVGATEEARREINAWVATRTAERIPELIKPDVLDVDTRLVLANAIYLKAPWERPFRRNGTVPHPFTRADGTQVDVPMMTVELDGARRASGAGWEAVELRYAGSKLAMAVVVPDPGRVSAVEQLLADAGLGAVLGAFRPSPSLRLDLPRWTFRTPVELRSALSALGMPTAFRRGVADFSGMTTEEQLAIGAVVHEAFVAVDEEGTEAAAATAVQMVAVSLALPPPVQLVVDRPFLFVIHDVETSTPLFVGRVADPTA